ncbi:MAG: C40 family peptidase [Selenomonadaceae bacterium]|nr:C40 family peptidase [Selenomonadaceae bacterium]
MARQYLGSREFNGYCQKFLRVVGERIGLPSHKTHSALTACRRWRVSTDKNIPVGAAIYLRGKKRATNGYKYGHVGIYAGDGKVIHALATVREQSLEEILETYNYLGWGWQAGVDLR